MTGKIAGGRKEILINVGVAEFRAAMLENGRLQSLLCETLLGSDDSHRPNRHQVAGGQIGDILLGRVRRVMPGMQAAFVDIGLERAGFLAAREAECLAASQDAEAPVPGIGACVREGDSVLVQIIKMPAGEKGARLSASVTLPGRLLVLTPQRPCIGISRRIEDETRRAALTTMCNAIFDEQKALRAAGCGCIVRSAAVDAGPYELRADLKRLAATWCQIEAARKAARPPALLHRDHSPLERILRDELNAQTARVLIDDREACKAGRIYCAEAMPDAVKKLELFSGPGMLFDSHGVEDDIAQLTKPRVPLPCGGWITIESTEALTAIDVNSGGFGDAAGPEQTSLRVNCEAATEIGRQLRLREIGGPIVVDFIRMDAEGSRACVLSILRDNLARDGAPVQISSVPDSGLVAITRKRVRAPLWRQTTETCAACHGSGRIRTSENVAFEILRSVERAAAAAPGKRITVHAAPDVARWLDDRDGAIRAGLARRQIGNVSFVAREGYSRETFDVATGA